MIPRGEARGKQVREHVGERRVAQPGRVGISTRVSLTVHDHLVHTTDKRPINGEEQRGEVIVVGGAPNCTHLIGDDSLSKPPG
jgi:hypothetical protein